MTDPAPATRTSSPRAPATWVAGLVGFTVQAAVLVTLTVVLVHTAFTVDGDDADDPLSAAFLDLAGGIVYGVAALATGVAAVLVLLVLGLSIRPGGGRVAALIVGIVGEVPIVAVAVSTLQDGVDPPEVGILAGAALVLVAVVTPATWRWCRRARPAPPAPPARPVGGPPVVAQ